MPHYTAFAGWIAGAVNVAAFIPYVLSIFGREIKWSFVSPIKRIEAVRPNIASWIIWTIVGALIALSYRKVGATDTMWVPIAMFLGPLVIAILSIRYGSAEWDAFDWMCLIGAAVTILVWQITKSAPLAVAMGIMSDGFAALATGKHAFKNPQQESALAWALFFAGDLINLVALPSEKWALNSYDLWLYPIYMVVQTGAIFLIITLRSKYILAKAN